MLLSRTTRVTVACLLLCLAACGPEDTVSDTSVTVPATATVVEAPSSAPASPADPAPQAPAGPGRVETLDVPPVRLPAPAPKCTDSKGQPVSCDEAAGADATGPTPPPADPTAPPATTSPPRDTRSASSSPEPSDPADDDR